MDDRLVPLDGPANFRDLGGYETDHGRRVRSGRVFRSDSLSFMSDEDVRHVTEVLGLRTVVDLRAGREVEQFTHGPLEALPVTVWHVPIVDETRRDASVWSNGEIVALDDLYLMMLERFGHRFVAVLDIIAAGDSQPVVFHSAAGKDRTGVLAALLLLALGVPEDVVVDDYQLTELAVARQAEWLVRHEPESAAEMDRMPAWIRASRPYVMRAFLDGLRADHGSPEGYLSDIGIDRAVITTLQERLLV